IGKIRPLRRLTQHEAGFMLQHSPAPFKVTMPTPIRGQGQAAIPAPYTSWDEIQEDIVAIFRQEMVALANEGIAYLQFDKVITAYANADSRAAMQQRGIDPEQALIKEIAWENSCYDAVPRENVTLSMHLCRGNRASW